LAIKGLKDINNGRISSSAITTDSNITSYVHRQYLLGSMVGIVAEHDRPYGKYGHLSRRNKKQKKKRTERNLLKYTILFKFSYETNCTDMQI
jgi:hypothetical protein